MAGLFKKSLAGPGFVILNIIRGINIIAFLDIIAASVAMLIKISINNNFFFFEAVNHVVTAVLSIFLILSELPILDDFFTRRCPQLSNTAGFAPLALVMVVLGVSVVGNLNNNDYSEKELGMSFWQVVASAGILSMTMGIVNFIASFIFADSSDGENPITARQVRANGRLAQKSNSQNPHQRSFKLPLNRADTLPTYGASTRSMSMRNNNSNGLRLPIKISSPVREQGDNISKSGSETHPTPPDLAHHPALNPSEFV
ncbi:hypothetical protein BGW36DRAFT_378347 [Talaromyces proteolyticus]|uniref:DUF7598 domain-containing protein n=1 Tax=Talaromyces proteolyticus TaxID=1131652 RepID=A0AAD4KQU1_9EURO|nr:uncharacterized protein BGW36DRAFT_378347 [Talaromyces proteolyticus]KAH8697271.1 hypothetical protein BGW36DRAFT_378347 [Talaromyces proteolyticus]